MELPFERDAIKNKPLPHGLTPAEQIAYTQLRELYRSFREGHIDRKSAGEEKEKIVASYTAQRGSEQFLSRECLKLQKRIFDATAAFEKDPSPENAVALYEAFWNRKFDPENPVIPLVDLREEA